MTRSLITGGAGFIGSHLAELLLKRGDQVSIIDNESTGTRDNLAGVIDHPRLSYLKGDVADSDIMRELLQEADEVYHLAAAVGVQLIASSPIHTLETNIRPTENLLAELGKLHDQGREIRFFLASTSEVYGKNPKTPWVEDDDIVFGATTRPRWSYGVSKAVDEFFALAYAKEKGMPIVIGRFFNVVGPRQTGAYGMVLPRFVDAAIEGRPIVIHDDGDQVRCFAHVQDVIRAIVSLVALPDAFGNIYNIGSDRAASIRELAELVRAEAGCPELPFQFVSYAEAYSADFEDCRRRVPDLSRLEAAIGYEPEYTLEEIVKEVVAYKRNELQRR